jgi:hypothetical protein
LTGETFEVEYVYYILIILCLMTCIFMIARWANQSRLSYDPVALADKARTQKLKEIQRKAKAAKRQSNLSSNSRKRNPVMKRELSRIPTPWGWPQFDEDGDIKSGEAGFSASLQRLADRLIHEKKTVQDQAYMDKRNASMRALLEDRYGRSSGMAEIKYRNVRAPLLRDPNAPHDQMDNFPSGTADLVAAMLRNQSGSQEGRPLPSGRDATRTDLKNLKRPWGW